MAGSMNCGRDRQRVVAPELVGRVADLEDPRDLQPDRSGSERQGRTDAQVEGGRGLLGHRDLEEAGAGPHPPAFVARVRHRAPDQWRRWSVRSVR